MNLETPLGTASGYSAPHVTQFSVFLDNRVGRLLHLLEVFENQALTLAGFSILDATGHETTIIARPYDCPHSEIPFAEDDEHAIRESLRMILEYEGYQVAEAASGPDHRAHQRQ